MAQRRKTVTRGDLLQRYAATQRMTFDEAHDRHAKTDIEELRNTVESLEEAYTTARRRLHPTYGGGARRTFARSMPTTTLGGVTR